MFSKSSMPNVEYVFATNLSKADEGEGSSYISSSKLYVESS